jgi:hypothetical protein
LFNGLDVFAADRLLIKCLATPRKLHFLLQMNAFEILLDQDANLKLDEQQKVLTSLQGSLFKLQSAFSQQDKMRSHEGASTSATYDGSVELEQDIIQLEARLSQLTERVEVHYHCLNFCILLHRNVKLVWIIKDLTELLICKKVCIFLLLFLSFPNILLSIIKQCYQVTCVA